MKYLGEIKAVLTALVVNLRPSSIPSLRALLLGLLLPCLVPGMTGVGILIYRQYEDGRRQIDKDTIHTARAIMNVVDGDLDAAKIVALSLSTSVFVAKEDWPGFHKRASDLIKTGAIGSASVILIDATGQQLINTLVPWGTPLPMSTLTELIQRRFKEGKTFTTPVFIGAVSGKPRVTVAVPIKFEGKVKYLLGVSLDTNELAETLREQKLPPDWITSISDDNGTIAIRSINNEKFSGQLINKEVARLLLQTNEAAIESKTKEEVPALLVFSRSPTSHWAVGIAIPLAPLEAKLKYNLMLLGGCGLLLTLIGVWFALRLSNRIAVSVQALTQSAQALASGDGPRPFKPNFREAAEALDAIVRTAELLNERGQALATSQATLQEQDAVLADAESENKQMQETSRLKNQFLANMSHELRTPLNAIIGFADLLHSGLLKSDPFKHQEFLGRISTAGRHLLQLINDVLDLSKVESGKFEFFPEHIDITKMLKEIQNILHTPIANNAIRISSEIYPDLTNLTLDPTRLKQVFYNYLSNAIKFTPKGGSVIVRVLGEGPEHFRIEVEDTGIGISASDLSRLFSEFQQIDAGYNKQHQGTGLGLALTRRLVEAQGGKVGVRSTVGVGSVFYAVLNRTHGFDTKRAEPLLPDIKEHEAERMLVIEDNQHDQALIVEALSQAGFEVDSAANSSYALQQAYETAYAALTLDLSLPDQRGLELLDEIRSRGASHASPVIGVSIAADSTMNATFAIANVLCKPMRSNEVLSAMERFKLLDTSRANVMIIDDDQASLDLMYATLKSIGIDAVCFEDGRVALQEIDNCKPDAIVLDLMMPEFDGFQVLDALQRLPAWRNVPVFIWTSMLLTDEEYATLARSARAILIKGGGSMEAVLESLRRWRQPIVVATGSVP